MVRGLPGCNLVWTESYECLETVTTADEPLETGPMNSDQGRLEMDRTDHESFTRRNLYTWVRPCYCGVERIDRSAH